MLASPLQLEVPSIYADGYVNWDQRASAPNIDQTSGTIGLVGYHTSLGLQLCEAFTFRFGNGSPGSGLPQGRVITECYLQLHSGNGNTTGLEFLWLAVENNLNPTKLGKAMSTPNPDRFTDGVNLAGNPWQRLTAQTAATNPTTGFGRSGVTHSGTISTSVGPRDPNALIYQAFRQNRTDGSSRTWGTGVWNDTCDFAPALTALIADPAWNPDLQYVTVFMFTANHDNTSGTDVAKNFGVGELGLITYNNGQDGVPYANVNAGGQLHMFESGLPPRLKLAHSSPGLYEPLDLAAGNSELTGHAFLTGKDALFRFRGRRWTATLADGGLVPKLMAGADDLPIWDMTAANPQTLVWSNSGGAPLDSKVKRRVDGRMPSGAGLILEGFAGRACNFAVNPFYPPSNVGYDMEAYSMRFYHAVNEESTPGDGGVWGLIQFYKGLDAPTWPDGSKYVWDILLRGGDVQIGVPGIGTIYHHGEIQIRGHQEGTGPQIFVPYEYPIKITPQPDVFRWEIQVDQHRNPKIRVRLYYGANSTVIYKAWDVHPTFDVSMGYVQFGKSEAGYLPIQNYGDIELHPNYSLSGEFDDPVRNNDGHPYKPPTWDWFEWGGDRVPQLEDLGVVTSLGPPVVTDGVALVHEEDRREIWNPDGYITTTNVNYSPGGMCTLDRYRPTTFAPAGGRPLAVFIHGGFFVGGDKYDLMGMGGLIDLFITMGWEIASINYPLSAATPLTYPEPYDPNANRARHPSHIVCAKLAVRYMSLRPDVDASRILVMGYSAGATLAAAVAYTRGVTVGGRGENLTVSNTDFGGSASWTDPAVCGALMINGPIDLTMAAAYDPSVPKWMALGAEGNIRLTCKAYMGRNTAGSYETNNTALQNYVLSNTAYPVPPTYYQRGGSDFLVHWEHWDLLRTALESRGAQYRYRLNRSSNHDHGDNEWDAADIKDWVQSLP